MRSAAARVVIALAVLSAGCEIVAGIKSRPLASGGTGGGGGAAGTSAGTAGTTGGGGTGGTGFAGTGGSVGGAGGKPTRIGTSCPNLSDIDCDGPMSRTTLACGVSNLWTTGTTCPIGQLCDSRPGVTHGSCLPVIPECADHSPDDHVCISGALASCGPDLVSSDPVDPCLTAAGACERCKPVILASGQSRGTGVAIDSTYVYWITSAIGAHAWRTSVDGSGGAMDLGSMWPGGTGTGGTMGGVRASGYVAIENGFLYAMTTDMTAYVPCRIPIDGGPAFAVDSSGTITASSAGLALAVDANNVYWASASYLGGAILTVPSTGGTSTPLATNQGTIQAITFDATSVYWTTSNGTVGRASIDGTSTKPIASGQQNPRAITVMDGNLYWIAESKIMTMPVGGGTPVALNTAPSGTGLSIAVDSTNVYFTSLAIFRLPRTGGTPVTVASASSPVGLAIDDTHIYWSNSADGTIVKIAK